VKQFKNPDFSAYNSLKARERKIENSVISQLGSLFEQQAAKPQATGNFAAPILGTSGGID
jgi:hypothetical protein